MQLSIARKKIMGKVLIVLVLSATISAVLVPILIIIANKFHIYDYPNNRSVHEKPTPLLGGLAIALSTIITILICCTIIGLRTKLFVSLGLITITIIGVIDDIKSLSAKLRLLIVAVLSMIMAYGFMEIYFNWEILHEYTSLQIVFFVLLILFATSITNAINFVDGLDGLASGLALTSLFGFSVIFYLQGRTEFAIILSVAAMGSLIGYLPFNKYKAKIFMGDAGSMFLGFYLASLSIILVAKTDSILSSIIPLFILFVPIADMLTSIIRRLILKKSIFKPDKMHFHHILRQKYSISRSVLILCSGQVIMALIGIFIFISELYVLGWIIYSAVTIILSILYVRYIKNAYCKA